MKNSLVVLAIFLCYNVQAQCDRRADSLNLITLYNEAGGSGWINTWDLESPMDTWYGIHLNAEGCVDIIDLDNEDDGDISIGFEGNGLTGSLSSSISNLKSLRKLIIRHADFNQEIPAFLSEMTSLDTLSIRNSNLQGELPATLANLTNLAYLSFTGNELTGEVPVEFGSFEYLRILFISGNNLEGNIPASLGTIDSIVAIGMSFNQLTGEIPDGFVQLPNFRLLTLTNNNLEGCIPQSFIDSCHFDIRLDDNALLPFSGNIEDLCTITDQVGLICDDGFLGTVNDSIDANCDCVGEVEIYDSWCDISGRYNFTTVPWCGFIAEGELSFVKDGEFSYDVYVLDAVGDSLYDTSFGAYQQCYGGTASSQGSLELKIDGKSFYWIGTDAYGDTYFMDDVYLSEDTLIFSISTSYDIESWVTTITRKDSTVWNDETCVLDEDEDGVIQAEDCDDMNASISPMQEEIPYNGIDDDCNEATLDDDIDEDGYLLADDCNDLDSLINPEAMEIVNNDIDENCDGEIGTSSILELAGVKIDIKPNPATDYILIDSEREMELEVRVIDVKGSVVLPFKILTGALSVQELPAGVYFLEIVNLDSKERIIEKIIVLK